MWAYNRHMLIHVHSTQSLCGDTDAGHWLGFHQIIDKHFSISRPCQHVGVLLCKFTVHCVIFWLMPAILHHFVSWFFLYQVNIVIHCRRDVSSITSSQAERLNTLTNLVWDELTWPHIIKSGWPIHWGNNNFETPNLYMWNRIFKPFDNINWGIGVGPNVPASNRRVIRATNNYVSLTIECHGVDSTIMSTVFIYCFALCHICHYYVFISPSCHKFRIISGYLKATHIVIMQIFIIFYHDVLVGVIKTHTPVFRAWHYILSCTIKLHCVDWAHMGLY